MNLVRVFSDVSVAFLYFGGKYIKIEKPLKYQRRLGLKAVTGTDSAEAAEITEWVRTEFT